MYAFLDRDVLHLKSQRSASDPLAGYVHILLMFGVEVDLIPFVQDPGQSIVYGGRTKGLSSILQHITMSAKRFWPPQVFLDLAAIGAGIAVWSGEMVRDQVSLWYPDMVLDLHSTMQNDGEIVVDGWMQELGRWCKIAGIPAVQWFDDCSQNLPATTQPAAPSHRSGTPETTPSKRHIPNIISLVIRSSSARSILPGDNHL